MRTLCSVIRTQGTVDYKSWHILQLVADEAVNGQLTFMIQVSGTVRYQDKSPKTFQQNFIITAQGDKWKIVTDCFRLQEPIGSKWSISN